MSPEGNFITAILTLVFVAFVSWEYVVRGRYTVVAFLRRERISRSLEQHARAITGYLFRYLYKGEAGRIYPTAYPVIRVALFGIAGTASMFLVATGAYLTVLGRIVFKAMIIVVGLNIDNLAFLAKVDSISRALAEALGMFWLYNAIFAPFVAIITFLTQFELSLDVINLTCEGSTAPMKLLGNLLIIGIVVVLIESEFAVFKGVVYDSLVEKFRDVTLNVAYRRWNPAHFAMQQERYEQAEEKRGVAAWKVLWSKHCTATVSKTARYFSFHYLGILLSSSSFTLLNNADLFQNSLQFLASRVVLKDFASYRWVSHGWDENCNVIKGFPMFDTGIALGASVVAWLLLCPALYTLSGVLIPGLPPGTRPITEHEQRSLGALKWKEWYRMAWKYSSFLAPDLWWAEIAYHWVKFVARNTPYDVGDRAPSVAQVESLVHDPITSRSDHKASKGKMGDVGYMEAPDSVPPPVTIEESPLQLSAGTTAALAQLERPGTRLFRIVVQTDLLCGAVLYFFTCDRVVNEARVWQRVQIQSDEHGKEKVSDAGK